MTDLRTAAQIALEALEWAGWKVHCENDDDPIAEGIKVLKAALAQQGERNFCPRCGKRAYDGVHICTPPQARQIEPEPQCSNHPDAPHGFNRNASHNAGRYVCDCEGWMPPKTPEQIAKGLEYIEREFK